MSDEFQKRIVALSKKQDRIRIDALRYAPGPVLSRNKKMKMTAANEFWTGTALWERRANVWTCVQTSPSMTFLKGANESQAKNELLKRGCKWEWETDDNH